MSRRAPRTRLLAALNEHGPMTRGQVEEVLGIKPGPAIEQLTSAERWGLIAYDADTNRFSIQEAGIVRLRRKNNPTNSTAGASGRAARSGQNPGGSRAEPSIHPQGAAGTVVGLEAERDRLIVEMSGPGSLALHVVRNEPAIYEELAAALADGMAPPDLLPPVPRYKQIHVIEAALGDWRERSRGGPCGICGTRTANPARGLGYLDQEPAPFTSHGTYGALCGWCQQALTLNSPETVREMVGNAIAGTIGLPAGGYSWRYAFPAMVPFASEVSTYGGTPWSHITEHQRQVIQTRAAQVVHPSRFVRTTAQQAETAVPNVVPPVHSAPRRAPYVPPTVLRGEEAAYREREAAALRRHASARDAFLAANPPGHVPGGAPWTTEQQVAWTALQLRQRDELVKVVDKTRPPRADGLSHPKRPHVDPLPKTRIG